MKKVKFLLCVLLCILLCGCSIQIGTDGYLAGWGVYHPTPAEAYMDAPFTDHLSHTYLYSIDEELACIPVTKGEMLWVAILNENHIVEMPMLINNQHNYYSRGICNVTTITPDEYNNESNTITFPTRSFDFSSDMCIYSCIYRDTAYEEIQNQLDNTYTAIHFTIELSGDIYNLVYVYTVAPIS